MLLFPLSRTILPAMWRQPLRWMLLMLLGLAFLGGTMVQALPPSGALQTTRAASPMPSCTDAGMAQTDAPAPVKGITPDCVKLTKCLGIPFSPGPAAMASAPVAYAAAYWSSNPLPGGLSPVPFPFPPRSA